MAHRTILQIVSGSEDAHNALWLNHTHAQRDGMIQLSFESFAEDGIFQIGNSLASDIAIAGEDGDVADHHIQISIHPSTGMLLLREESIAGSCVSPLGGQDRGEEKLKFHHAFIPILQPLTITFGNNDRLRFHLLPTLFHCGADAWDEPFREIYLPAHGLDPTTTSYQGFNSRSAIPLHTAHHEFVILQVIGQVSTGTTRLCMRMSDGCLFVIKAQTDQYETIAHRNVWHPNIVDLIEEVVHGEDSFSILEYAPHRSLDGLLREQAGVPLARDVLFTIASQILSALSYMHERDWIYHNACPSNTLIFSYSPPLVKLCDFQNAVHDSDGNSPDRGGSPLGYTAPERIDNPTSKVDIYSVGVIILNMLGHWPWMDTDPAQEIAADRDPTQLDMPILDATELNAYGDAGFVRLLEAMLEHDPDLRPDADQCLEALAELDKHFKAPQRMRSWIRRVDASIATILQPKPVAEAVRGRGPSARRTRQATTGSS
ncbi:hypothetical protein KVT40_003280 [Elsinoe batatas]|uniref:Protein kinase domain-containing protein n=1 Tax=Elsinoe batatas TaxID=2601811 RepID=A0A8K0PEN7_9PEZI|nr:hypothetical protein KVT40_003280 [Elsinoe batatas]